VASIPEGQEILFLPDQFLGAHVERQTGRKMHIGWVSATSTPGSSRRPQAKLAAEPDAELLVHPECGCTTNVMWLLGEGELPADRTKVLSTADGERGGGVAHRRSCRDETGILHQLRRARPDKEFVPIDAKAECKYMKRITPENLLTSLRTACSRSTCRRTSRCAARAAVERNDRDRPTAGRTVPAGPVFSD
jgi:quinolinate synthase